ncbi:putative zinc-binding protein [bacterium]|nr:putative zinc-binding protein [bacterium]
MKPRPGCGCGKLEYNIVFACSGAADVGLISDRAARSVAARKAASMICIAAVGAGIEEIMEKARGAKRVLAIDGCDKACAFKVLEKAGIEGFISMRLDTLGLEKSKTPVDEAVVEKMAAHACGLLAAPQSCCA